MSTRWTKLRIFLTPDPGYDTADGIIRLCIECAVRRKSIVEADGNSVVQCTRAEHTVSVRENVKT